MLAVLSLGHVQIGPGLALSSEDRIASLLLSAQVRILRRFRAARQLFPEDEMEINRVVMSGFYLFIFYFCLFFFQSRVGRIHKPTL